MADAIIYIQIRQNVVVQRDEVYLSDLASVYCEDEQIREMAKHCLIYSFSESDQKRCVISVMKMVELLTKKIHGITVENLGGTDVIVKHQSLQKKEDKYQILKLILVSFICFIGSTFTIMAFHNDIGITGVFEKIYFMATGEETNYHTILEISYALGLGIGITVFYNHMGKRTMSKDPTPLNVEMRIYERDVEQAVVEQSEREKVKIDVDS